MIQGMLLDWGKRRHNKRTLVLIANNKMPATTKSNPVQWTSSLMRVPINGTDKSARVRISGRLITELRFTVVMGHQLLSQLKL